MPPPRQPLQNVAWLVGERVARAAVTATVLGLVARHLQPDGFGRLNFAVAVGIIGASLANCGLEGLVVSELVRQPAAAGAILGSALRLRLLSGAVTVALLAGGAFAVPAWRGEAGVVAIVALGLLLQPVEVVDLWFQRHLDSRRTVLVRFVGILAGAALKLALVAAGAGVTAFAWAQVADAACIGLGLAWAGWRSPYATGPWTWDPEIGRELWRRGAPLALSALAVAFALKLDQLVVRSWLGEGAAGIYFAAARLSDLVLFAGTATALSLFPGLAAAQQAGQPAYRARLQAMFDALSALGWIAALGFAVAGPLLVRLLFGPAYAGAVPVLLVQGWSCLVALNANVRWHFILLSAPTLLNLAAAALHVATLLGAATWLVPRLGLAGAAGAWLAAALVSGVLTSWLFPALRPCAGLQLRGFLIPFTPARWPDLLGLFRA